MKDVKGDNPHLPQEIVRDILEEIIVESDAKEDHDRVHIQEIGKVVENIRILVQDQNHRREIIEVLLLLVLDLDHLDMTAKESCHLNLVKYTKAR